ncbi:type 1 glutamine amidotransferase [Natrarchaeobaculum sulfurireducens]|uniref:GMP synthase n=1 Tax=Natrarchaeobaculum sulfurireducens TaxID=2044521 RepID=A0A346PUV2_9EURY|nr:gamma-glutamyl-gamma-aminobutyrate hydrolase family protein [Natrarchaeobaculum sulfurireducens]AXR79524.1 GMP synthase - Glutamine amidotransferase domain [Natrarchaeobaculum sulfurireducens]AXR83297.1 GMP synthase [Natrarchaeobaculum sulfurireducens]
MSEPTLVVVRNEVDPDCTFHCDAISDALPDARTVAYPDGDRPDLEAVDGVVLSGSTAGVYEADDRPWIVEQQALVDELLEREIPTLGICFGHQLVNAALGGTVEPAEETCRPVRVDIADDPLFRGLEPVVPVVHGDVVTEVGDGLEVLASADYYHAFATRHREAPLWTVQFHPELTAAHRDRLAADFDWTEADYGFDDVNARRVLENFVSIVADC